MSPGIRSYLLGTQSDDRLVGLVRGGSEPAFEALVHRYRRPLLRYCRRLCGSEMRAEEALQQALTNVWVALRRGAEVRDVRAWLYRIAHNAAVSSMRGERTALAEDASYDLDGRRVAALTPAVGVSSIDDVLAVRDAFAGIAALPQMQREVMVRTAVGGDSHEQVASALGISDGAVRGLLHRARCTLRAGMTAVTPAPLLSWAAGGSSPAAGERIAELAAGGGAAGLGGIAGKGGVLAITAGMAVAGSMIAGHHGRSARHEAPTSARGQLFSTAAGGLGGAAAADLAMAGGSREGGAGRVWMLAGAGANHRSSSPRGRDGGGNERLAQDGRGDGSRGSGSLSQTSSDGTSSGGDRAGTSRDGGSSSTSSSDGSGTQLASSSSGSGSLSSDGEQSSGGSLESQSSDGKSGSLEPESQLQGSSSDGGTVMQSGTSGGSGSGDSSSGSSDGGSSSTTTTTTRTTSSSGG